MARSAASSAFAPFSARCHSTLAAYCASGDAASGGRESVHDARRAGVVAFGGKNAEQHEVAARTVCIRSLQQFGELDGRGVLVMEPQQSGRQVSPRDFAVGRKFEPPFRGVHRALELEIVVAGSRRALGNGRIVAILRCAAVQAGRFRPFATLERPFRADREIPDVTARTMDVVRARYAAEAASSKAANDGAQRASHHYIPALVLP